MFHAEDITASWHQINMGVEKKNWQQSNFQTNNYYMTTYIAITLQWLYVQTMQKAATTG